MQLLSDRVINSPKFFPVHLSALVLAEGKGRLGESAASDRVKALLISLSDREDARVINLYSDRVPNASLSGP